MKLTYKEQIKYYGTGHARYTKEWQIYDQIDDEYKNDEEQREVLRAERQNAARERNAEFLKHSGAIPLEPIMYAAWLREHLRAGGSIVRTEPKYPLPDAVESFEQSAQCMWYVTDITTEAPAMPAGFGAQRLRVFFDIGAETFRRQYFRGIGERIGSTEPSERGSFRGPFLASGAYRAFGDSTVHFYPFLGPDHKGREITYGAYTNKPNEVVAYTDILPMLRDMTWNEPFMVHRLDEIAITGMCRAVNQQG